MTMKLYKIRLNHNINISNLKIIKLLNKKIQIITYSNQHNNHLINIKYIIDYMNLQNIKINNN
jgi:hypothetical protein